MNALLEKFKKITVKTTTLIPAEDKVELDKLHLQYEETMEQLDVWRAFYELEDRNDELAGFSMELYGATRSRYNRWVQKPLEDPGKPFHHLKYYIGNAYKEVAENIEKCKNAYIRTIYRYFTRKYALKLNEDTDSLVEDDKLTYLKVIKSIRDQLGGLNFHELSKQQVIDRVRSRVAWKKNAALSGRIVSLHNFYYGGYSNSIGYHNEYLIMIEEAVSLFERGQVVRQLLFSQLFYGGAMDYTIDYTFDNLEKLTALRFYLNNKVSFKFKTPAQAKEFFEFFDLGGLTERDW